MRLLILATACAALALTACGRKAETPAETAPAAEDAGQPATANVPTTTPLTPPQGFSHQAQFDPQGFYLPPNPVTFGNYRLTAVGVGAPSDFQQWESGDRGSVYGPILFQFDDLTSAVVTNEMGGEGRAVTVRVLPEAYAVTSGTIAFKGVDPKLGEVVFDGRFDPAALAQARNEGGSGGAVLTGLIKVGDSEPRPISMVYFVGE